MLSFNSCCLLQVSVLLINVSIGVVSFTYDLIGVVCCVSFTYVFFIVSFTYYSIAVVCCVNQGLESEEANVIVHW